MTLKGSALYVVAVCLCLSASARSTTCPVPTSVGVVICAPGNESIVSSPVEISAAGLGNVHLTGWKIYVDGVSVWQTTGTIYSIDPFLSMISGSHHVTVKAWDANGNVYSQAITITVSTSTSGCTGGADRTVVICSTYVRGGRVAVTAKAFDKRPVSAMKMYVNSTASCYVSAATLASNGNTLQCAPYMPYGWNKLTIRAWDSLGPFSVSKDVYNGLP